MTTVTTTNDHSIDTRLAQAGHYIDPASGGIVPPIQPSSTYARGSDNALLGVHGYARAGNPNLSEAEEQLAALDGGTSAMLFASGMSAITTAMETLRSGDRVVAPDVMYHGTRDWLAHLAATRGIELVSFGPSDPDGLERAVANIPTQLVWIETSVNPTWDVIDVAAAAEIAHANGAWLAVDSTVSPPVTTRPLELGADLVFHSATKYLNGHSDITGGVLITKSDDERWQAMSDARAMLGGILGAFETWLLMRGMRTLAVRFERASGNALRIARHFEHHPGLQAVLYPGLESHPGHAIAARQMRGGFGGMMSLRVNGDATRAKEVSGKMKVFVRATSLGGVESLVEHRASVETPGSKVPQDLLRLSIGIESGDDLIADIEQALN